MLILFIKKMFMYNEEDNEDEEKCIYTAKYGKINLTSTQFDDHSLLGANFFQYKPEKIFFRLVKIKKFVEFKPGSKILLIVIV